MGATEAHLQMGPFLRSQSCLSLTHSSSGRDVSSHQLNPLISSFSLMPNSSWRSVSPPRLSHLFIIFSLVCKAFRYALFEIRWLRWYSDSVALIESLRGAFWDRQTDRSKDEWYLLFAWRTRMQRFCDLGKCVSLAACLS